MRDTYKNIWMWALYGLLFLLTAAVQTVVFGRDAVLGAKLCLLPALVLCQTVLFLFKFYIGTAVPAHLRQTLLQIAVSMLCCPPLYLAAWAIRKAGA